MERGLTPMPALLSKVLEVCRPRPSGRVSEHNKGEDISMGTSPVSSVSTKVFRVSSLNTYAT
jgi:hypothetical protein